MSICRRCSARQLPCLTSGNQMKEEKLLGRQRRHAFIRVESFESPRVCRSNCFLSFLLPILSLSLSSTPPRWKTKRTSAEEVSRVQTARRTVATLLLLVCGQCCRLGEQPCPSRVPSCRRNALETLRNEMVQSCRLADRKYEGDARTYQRGLKIGPPEKEKKGHEKGRLLQG